MIRKARSPKPSVVREVLTRLGDRMNLVAGLSEIGLFEVLYTDFTELIFTQGNRKCQLMPIVEHASKLCLGWALGRTATTEVALEAFGAAKRKITSLGLTTKGIIVHHDQDPVYTGYAWLGEVIKRSGARLSYALRGAMESFNGHFKPESEDLFFECTTLAELEKAVANQMVYYNRKRRHSSLGNVAPLTYLKLRR